ncbi:MAG: regulatory protein RecX, partial [Clostridiales bacterium]
MTMSSFNYNKKCSSPEELRAAALNSLDRRACSVWELTRKLKQKGGQTEDIEPIIEEFLAQGWLDDQKFAESLVHDRKELYAKGPAYIKQELYHKGVDSSIISESIAEYYPKEDEEIILKKLLPKALMNYPQEDRDKQFKFRNKLIKRFMTQGFSYSAIQLCLASWE